MNRKKIGFDNGQQYSNISETARQIKLIDESIDTLKLSTLLALDKYNQILILNVETQPD